MFMIFGIALCLLLAIISPGLIRKLAATRKRDSSTGEIEMVVPKTAKLASIASGTVFGLIALMLMAGTSYINVGDTEIAQMKRIYLADNLPAGRIIGVGSQKGKKADTIGPGFHVVPGLNLLNDVEIIPMVNVPPGHYRKLSARDGRPLPPGVTYAPSFQAELLTYLDAETFLTTEEPNVGFKGPQVTVLPPGDWRINTYLWEVSEPEPVTNVPEGTVAVIKSNAVTAVNFGSEMTAAYPTQCAPVVDESHADGLTTPLVPVGCIGIWKTALGQGAYYVNRDVFSVTEVPIRVQAWEYEGGFTARSANLEVGPDGEITQTATSNEIAIPETAAAGAIDIKIDGYTIYQGARILVQVDPKDAPFVVASVGSLEEVEDRIVTPATQSTLRDLAGTMLAITEVVTDPDTGAPIIDEQTGEAQTRSVRRPINPMDLITERDRLQSMAEELIRPEGEKAGVTIQEVRLLKPDLPPEVLIPAKRRQLAVAMVQTMEQERKAQVERIAREQAAATADQQADLVTAQIRVKKAEQFKEEQKLRGEAERLRLEEIAQGQAAQVAVLGEERTMQLRVIEMALGLIESDPSVLGHLAKLVPDTYVAGGEGGDGLATLGALFKRGMEKSSPTGGNNTIQLDDATLERLAAMMRK